jgi:hypothetical protein
VGEAVRIKVYGLFELTRRRYLIQAGCGALCIVGLLLAWWLGWPALRARLRRVDLPPVMVVVSQVLEHAPWVLIGAAVYKAVELVVVLRLFARKARAAASAPAPVPAAPPGADAPGSPVAPPQIPQQEVSSWPNSTPPAS